MQAVVFCPNVTGFRSVRFLIDTGADYTILSPRDAALLQFAVPPINRETRVSLGGLGGNQTWFFPVEAEVIFGDPYFVWYQWETRIRVYDIWTQDLSSEAWRVPSLLGRDFLNQCQMDANGLQGILHLTPTPGENIAALPPIQSP